MLQTELHFCNTYRGILQLFPLTNGIRIMQRCACFWGTVWEGEREALETTIKRNTLQHNICLFSEMLLAALLSFSTLASFLDVVVSVFAQREHIAFSSVIGEVYSCTASDLKSSSLIQPLHSSDSVQDEQMENCLLLFGCSVAFAISFKLSSRIYPELQIRALILSYLCLALGQTLLGYGC